MCVPNKTEEVNIKVSNMVTVVSEAKKLAKRILHDCKGAQLMIKNGIQIKNEMMKSADASLKNQ